MAVQIAWITASVVCALAILIGLFTGTGGGNSSQRFPGFAFSAGRDSSHQSPGFTLLEPAAAMSGAAAQKDRGGWGKEGAPGDSHSGSGVPPRSGSQPEITSGRTPVVTPRPKPPRALGGDPVEAPQAPSVAPPKPAKPPKEPSMAPPKAPKPAKAPKPPKEPKEPEATEGTEGTIGSPDKAAEAGEGTIGVPAEATEGLIGHRLGPIRASCAIAALDEKRYSPGRRLGLGIAAPA